MPARNEEESIGATLTALRRQDYSALQIIVVDGGSTDATVAVVEQHMAEDPRIELLHNPRQVIPAALNIALGAVRGRWVVRMDAHSTVDETYVGAAVARLREGRWGGVGGRKDGVGATPAGKAIAAALGSRFGVGGSLYHYGTTEQQVDHIPFGAYPTELLRRLGGWDERLEANEDFEFDYRLRRSGEVLLFDPRLDDLLEEPPDRPVALPPVPPLRGREARRGPARTRPPCGSATSRRRCSCPIWSPRPRSPLAGRASGPHWWPRTRPGSPQRPCVPRGGSRILRPGCTCRPPSSPCTSAGGSASGPAHSRSCAGRERDDQGDRHDRAGGRRHSAARGLRPPRHRRDPGAGRQPAGRRDRHPPARPDRRSADPRTRHHHPVRRRVARPGPDDLRHLAGERRHRRRLLPAARQGRRGRPDPAADGRRGRRAARSSASDGRATFRTCSPSST